MSANSGLIIIVLPRARFLRNCGKIEVQPLLSCRSVRYSSKVDTVVWSVFIVAIRLLLSGSSSNSMYTVQPRIPHGSFSDSSNIWAAIRGNRSAGSNTSVQIKCRRLAVRSSVSSRAASAWMASSWGDAVSGIVAGSSGWWFSWND